jgi:hypothetical protein
MGITVLSKKYPGMAEVVYNECQLMEKANFRTEIRNRETFEPTHFHRSYVLPPLLWCLKQGEISSVPTTQDLCSAPNHYVQYSN